MNHELIISGDGSPTLRDPVTGATFHSKHGALAESRHIFIDNGLLFAAENFRRPLSVLEAGFGTGLNAALTLLAARENNITVHYTGIEKYPLEEHVTARFAGRLDGPTKAALGIIGEAPWNAPQEMAGFRLRKIQADLCSWTPDEQFHVVYFDAFAPDVVPELWTETVFSKLAAAMPAGAALVTFCAQGEFRRRLKRTGFDVQKLPGAPGKREMTRGIKI